MNYGIFAAIIASVIWGLNYVFLEKALTKISIVPIILMEFFIGLLTFVIIAFFNKKSLIPEFHTLTNNKEILFYSVLVALTGVFGIALIGIAIKNSNATISGIIEISYPIFIIIFSFLLFRINNLTLPIIIGGLMIFGGVMLIAVFNK